MVDRLRDRFIVVGIGFVVFFLIILFQLINLQIINGKENDVLSQKRLLKERDIVAPRGNILDKNNIPIAVNRIGYAVQIFKTGLQNEQLNEMLLNLTKTFEKNNDIYNNSLSRYLVINPISYGPYIDKNEEAMKKWKVEMVVRKKDINLLTSAESVVKYFRDVKFKIDSKYSDEDAYKIMTIRYELLMSGYSSINPVYITRDVSKETIAVLEEKHNDYPGVFTEVIPVRRYIEADSSAHIIGYVDKIDSEEYKNLKDLGYGLNDLIGKGGVEVATEKYLKGTDGTKRVVVDAKGRQTDGKETVEKQAIPGNDVVLTLDTRLQKVASESLETNINYIKTLPDPKNHGDAYAGAVVAIDVENGEVLAMTSYPSFDPSLYLASSHDKEAQTKKIQMLKDTVNAPMLNRAMKGTYIPGSVFKPITGIAGVEEGIISPSDYIYDPGVKVIANWKFYCLEYRMGLGAHGNLDLKRALATSCNIYFHELGFRTGIDGIVKWEKLFGLGDKTGIDIPGEAKGLRADREWKMRVYKDKWWPADTAQVAIGQLYNSFTPLQLANYVASMANGGKRFTPYVIKKIISSDGKILEENKPKFTQIPVKKETLDEIRKGMEAVTNSVDGTASSTFKDFPFKVAGKTGTPETGNEAKGKSSNGLFICYAPAEKPKIAIAVVIEGGVWGSNAAPVARDILKEYFGLVALYGQEKKVESDMFEFVR